VLIPGRALSRRADILQNQWSPIYDISAILTSIQSLLSDPNPASPANSEASRLYSENRREYNRRVREIVENSWLDDTAEEDVAEKLPPPQDAGAVAGGPTVAVGQVAAES
jgi:hypothetical protein